MQENLVFILHRNIFIVMSPLVQVFNVESFICIHDFLLECFDVLV